MSLHGGPGGVLGGFLGFLDAPGGVSGGPWGSSEGPRGALRWTSTVLGWLSGSSRTTWAFPGPPPGFPRGTWPSRALLQDSLGTPQGAPRTSRVASFLPRTAPGTFQVLAGPRNSSRLFQNLFLNDFSRWQERFPRGSFQ